MGTNMKNMFVDRLLEEEVAARLSAGRLAIELRRYATEALAGWKPRAAETMHAAAAAVEGHVEAYAVVVRDNAGLRGDLAASRCNHDSALEIISRWRELLVALSAEHPDDIRLKRALLGEHPMRAAPWEKAQ